jgi:hypothetical protein
MAFGAALIFFKKLAWVYSAETISIVGVLLAMGIVAQKKVAFEDLFVVTDLSVYCFYVYQVLYVAHLFLRSIQICSHTNSSFVVYLCQFT